MSRHVPIEPRPPGFSRRGVLRRLGWAAGAGAFAHAPSASRAATLALLQPDGTTRVRRNVGGLPPSGRVLTAYRNAVRVMRARPATDPTSWIFQANIHGAPLGTPPNPAFGQCQHGNRLFVAWHRAYLFFFERIARAASGDPDFALPYWNWSDPLQRAIPAAFRVQASSLFDPTRLINNGAGLSSRLVVTDLDRAMRSRIFGGPSGAGGFSDLLENSPHGTVHTSIGGNMGRFATAGRDPIFWLHHCNIDRLWARWLASGGGRANPADAAWRNRTFNLFDETGMAHSITVADLLDTVSSLGYQYDDAPPAPPGPPPFLAMERRAVVAMAVSGAHGGQGAAGAGGRGASGNGHGGGQQGQTGGNPHGGDEKPPEEPPTRTVAAAQPEGARRLGLEPVRVQLAVEPGEQDSLARALARPGDDVPTERVLLSVEDIAFKDDPGLAYAVYLNPVGDDLDEAHYAGSISFFGKGETHDSPLPAPGDEAPGGEPAVRKFTQTIDVTELARSLEAEGKWDPAKVDVRIVPLLPELPPGEAREAQMRVAERSIAAAGITYGRVSLRVAL